jgi:predicted nucleotidyltransferase
MNEGGPLAPIENYLPQLKTVFEKYGVVLAFLYGSQATGTASPLSDVDIALLFGREVPEKERFDQVLRLHGELAHIFKRDDVNVVDIAQGTPLLNNEIRLHGIVLYSQADEVRVEFEIRALQRFLDTEPLRFEFNKYLAEKIRRGLFGKPIPIQPAKGVR